MSISVAVGDAVDVFGATSVGHLASTAVGVGHDMHGSLTAKVGVSIRIENVRDPARTSLELEEPDGTRLLPVDPAAGEWQDTVLTAAGTGRRERQAEEHLV